MSARNLKLEALDIAQDLGITAEWIRVKESKPAAVSPHWGAWVCHARHDGAHAGKAFVTLVHLHGTVFSAVRS